MNHLCGMTLALTAVCGYFRRDCDDAGWSHNEYVTVCGGDIFTKVAVVMCDRADKCKAGRSVDEHSADDISTKQIVQ